MNRRGPMTIYRKLPGQMALPMQFGRPPLHFSGYDQRETVSLGGIGQHTDEVLAEYGFTQDEIAEMREKKEIV